jgi:hypothetical protein
MGQITVTISDNLQERLESEAKERRITVDQVLEERLEPGLAILHKAWAKAARQPPLTEDEQEELALAAAREARDEIWRERHGDTSNNS